MMNIGKKILIFFIVTFLCIFMIACGTDKEVKVQAEKVIEAINTNDMNTLESIIMGTQNIVADDALADFFTTSDSENNGLIKRIITKDSIKIKKITKDTICYEITAPHLENIFNEILEKENLLVKDFEEAIYEYIEAAPMQTVEVKVAYTYKDGIFMADYNTIEFMNAITGNLIRSYQNLIQRAIMENEEEAE